MHKLFNIIVITLLILIIHEQFYIILILLVNVVCLKLLKDCYSLCI